MLFNLRANYCPTNGDQPLMLLRSVLCSLSTSH
jgi:hypothetical protein